MAINTCVFSLWQFWYSWRGITVLAVFESWDSEFILSLLNLNLEQSNYPGPYSLYCSLCESSSALLACYLKDLHPDSPLPLTNHLSALKYHYVLKCERSPCPVRLVRCIWPILAEECSFFPWPIFQAFLVISCSALAWDMMSWLTMVFTLQHHAKNVLLSSGRWQGKTNPLGQTTQKLCEEFPVGKGY